jgi:hypothetical protein
MQHADRTRIVRGRQYTYAGLRVLAVLGREGRALAIETTALLTACRC